MNNYAKSVRRWKKNGMGKSHSGDVMNRGLADKFVKIVEGVSPKMNEDEKARALICCPDQSVGIVKGACAPGEFKRAKIVEDYKGITDAAGRIILVLESPHDQEYVLKLGKWTARGPAHGCTGCQIRDKFREIFNGKFSVDNYELILVNAIQYQCSLGRRLSGKGNFSKEKNEIMRILLLHHDFQENLKRRLSMVWRQHSTDFIVNASSSKREICCLINSVITRITTRYICGIPHPSSWRNPKNLEKACDVIGTSCLGKER